MSNGSAFQRAPKFAQIVRTGDLVPMLVTSQESEKGYHWRCEVSERDTDRFLIDYVHYLKKSKLRVGPGDTIELRVTSISGRDDDMLGGHPREVVSTGPAATGSSGETQAAKKARLNAKKKAAQIEAKQQKP